MPSSIPEWSDAFGNQVALGTTNEADIAGHYPYNPERWRVFVNGTRQFIQYDASVPEFTDSVDTHDLTPQASGDVVRMATTERFRYVVQYVIEWSGALRTSQALEAGDAVVFGYGDPDLVNSTDDFPGPAADGWFFHWHADLDAQEVRIAEYRNGEVKSEDVVATENELTDWGRWAGNTNWYNVGETDFSETYTEDVGNDQRNPSLGKTSAPKEKGTQSANKPIGLSVKVGSASTAGSLTAELGSVGLRTLGQVDGIIRTKIASETLTVSNGTDGTYEPLMALRIDPEREIVNVQALSLDPVEFTGSGDVQLLGIAVDEQKTDADFDDPEDDGTDPGPAAPIEHNSTNSVIQYTKDITTFPDSTGSTVSTATNPGGYQIAHGTYYTSGTGSKTREFTTDGRTSKRQISDRDVMVILANAAATGDVTLEYGTEQDW
jgi:hypothetical protein